MSANLFIDDKYFISPKYYFHNDTDSRVLISDVPAETFVWKQWTSDVRLSALSFLTRIV